MKFLLIVIGMFALYGLSFLLAKHAPGLSAQEAFKLGTGASTTTVSMTNAVMLGFLMMTGIVVYKVKS